VWLVSRLSRRAGGVPRSLVVSFLLVGPEVPGQPGARLLSRASTAPIMAIRPLTIVDIRRIIPLSLLSGLCRNCCQKVTGPPLNDSRGAAKRPLVSIAARRAISVASVCNLRAMGEVSPPTGARVCHSR
jgi:hypothetical protein